MLHKTSILLGNNVISHPNLYIGCVAYHTGQHLYNIREYNICMDDMETVCCMFMLEYDISNLLIAKMSVVLHKQQLSLIIMLLSKSLQKEANTMQYKQCTIRIATKIINPNCITYYFKPRTNQEQNINSHATELRTSALELPVLLQQHKDKLFMFTLYNNCHFLWVVHVDNPMTT